MKKCIILSRVSTDAQDLVQQTNSVIGRCILDGYQKENIIIIEDKESAVKLSEAERLGLNLLKQSIIDDTEIDCVYAYEISRIGRRPDVNYSIRNFLKEHRVQLIILNPAIKLFTKDFEFSESDNMVFSIFNAMAENEGFIRKARLSRGKKHSKSLGKWAYGKPAYGYIRNSKTGFLEINHKEADVVLRVFKEYSEGNNTTAIGRNIVQEGIISNRSDLCAKKWAIALLKNDVYTGNSIYPRIISDELKNECDKIRETFRNKPRDTVNNDFALCRGLLKSPDGHFSYVCSAAGRKYGIQSSSSIKIDFADKIVFDFICEYDKIHRESPENVKDVYINELSSYTLKFNKAVSDRASLISKKDKIWERNVEGKISDERADVLSKNIDNELAKCIENIKEYENAIKRLNEFISSLHDEFGELIDNSINYDELSIDERKRMIRKYIDHIRLIHHSMYIVTFNFVMCSGEIISQKYYTRSGERI